MSAPASRAEWAGQGRSFAAGPPAPVGRDEARSRAFAAARRHSRLVRFLRVAAPAGVAVALAAMILGALFDPFHAKTGVLSIGAFTVDGTKIVMGRPKLTGFRRDGRAYAVNAASASQDVKRPAIVELRQIDGDLGAGGDGALHIEAAAGVYDNVRQSLDLSHDIVFRNASYVLRLTSANIDFTTGVYRSDAPVTLTMADGGMISADSALARDNGQELTFSGHVRSTFMPDAGAEPAS